MKIVVNRIQLLQETHSLSEKRLDEASEKVKADRAKESFLFSSEIALRNKQIAQGESGNVSNG